MKRIIKVWLFATVFCAAVAGCSAKSAIVGAEENNSETMMAMKYRAFTGEKKETFQVPEGKEAWILADIITEDGTLSVNIIDDKGECIYTGNDLTVSSSFSVNAKAGTYTILVTGNEHEGSYSFKWNIKDAQKDKAVTEIISLEDKAYNVYTGIIGTTNVMVALYPDKEQFRVDCTLLGMGDSANEAMICTYDLQGNISFEKGNKKLLLSQKEDDKLVGTYSDAEMGSMEIALTLSHINYAGEDGSRYTVGTNEEVEGFAREIQHMVEDNDLESLSTVVLYPLSVFNDGQMEIQNENQLIQLGEQLLTPAFKEAIENSYTQFMFNNYNGIMLGDGSYGIWFTKLESGLMKITGISGSGV